MNAGPIVLVYFAGQRPEAAVTRAVELAVRFGAPLHVLLVEPDEALATPAASPGVRDEGWLDRVLPANVARDYHHRAGQLVHEAVQHARAHHARMVLLPAEACRSGSCASAIAASAEVSVLIARDPMAGDAVVAATDLRDPRYPVLAHAADVMHSAETTLVGVHDIEDSVTASELSRRKAVMATALESISFTHEIVIGFEPEPVDAVLAAARERDADLIVVGVPPRTWTESRLHPSLAMQIVADARSSVLLIPIASGHPTLGTV
jgi:nucleotide-binding universal stress UspA family protein